jgi:hypothetical protein
MCISIRIFRNWYYHLSSRIPPKLLYLGCAMEKTARWNFLKLWQIMYLDITIQYFGFNTRKCCCWINMKYLAYLNILFGDNHVQNSANCKIGGMPWGPPWYNINLNILKIWRLKVVKFGAMMSICLFFSVTFFGGN